MEVENLDIILYPSVALKTKCLPINDIVKAKESLIPVIERMKFLMASYHGVGLSANQIGSGSAFFIMRDGPESEIQTIINPNILEYLGKIVPTKEGCLSIPGIGAQLQCRYNHIIVEYQNLDGETIQKELRGSLAQIFQHELNHLNGVTLFDRMGKAQREIKKAKYFKIVRSIKQMKNLEKRHERR